MDNINYLFCRKYFEFEKFNLSKDECIKQIISFNGIIRFQDLKQLDVGKLNIKRNIEELKSINDSILSYPLQNIDLNGCYKDSFSLQTTYPGLLMGSGYSHDYKASEDEVTLEGFKIGFFFDFTTGMPVIPGSSVKGALRSCFPQRVVKSKNRKNIKPKYSAEKEEFIKSELAKLGIKENIDIDILEREIFDGFGPKKGENLLRNPVPIKFLKVAPRVQYQFNFKLFRSATYPGITAEIKCEFLKALILIVGIGAKTNVGYGQFERIPEIGNKSRHRC